MKNAGNLYFSSFTYHSLLISSIFFLLGSNVMGVSHFSLLGNDGAYGHLTETSGAQSNVISKSIGNYVVLFQRIPLSAQGGNNSSTLLRFSIMQNSQDTYGVFAALTIKEKNSSNISKVFPYRLYEFGDIDFRDTFQNTVDNEVILQARISGDPQYQNNPLVVSFDVPAFTGGGLAAAPGNIGLIIVILVLVALPAGIIILILDFNKRMKRKSW